MSVRYGEELEDLEYSDEYDSEDDAEEYDAEYDGPDHGPFDVAMLDPEMTDALARMALRAGAIDVKTVTEELTASWFGWPVRTLEAAVRPGSLGWGWATFAYRTWQQLAALDERVLARVVPDELFYDVSVTGVRP